MGGAGVGVWAHARRTDPGAVALGAAWTRCGRWAAGLGAVALGADVPGRCGARERGCGDAGVRGLRGYAKG